MSHRIGILALGLVSLLACDAETNNEQPRVSTATANVTVLEKSFSMPGLNRQRTLRIYLPLDYQTTENHYPVLYMHDGQNLFDNATSYAGEWGIDETMNRLSNEQGLSLIVVGIDNGEALRMSELSPWENSDYAIAEGEQYMNFIVTVVKPYVDEHYRTLADQKNTAIMGSSMGGLISHYAIFNYPEIFSKAGVFSPSFWYSEDVYSFSDPQKLADNSRLYFIVGSEEGSDMVANLGRMTQQLSDAGFEQTHLYSKVVEGAEHNEYFWRTEFPEAILWLFSK